jgi:hypothetical protein
VPYILFKANFYFNHINLEKTDPSEALITSTFNLMAEELPIIVEPLELKEAFIQA